MRKNYLKYLSFLLCMLFCSNTFAEKKAYGFVLSSLAIEDVTFCSFDANKVEDGITSIESYKSTGKPQAAAYAEGAYYLIGRANGASISLQKTDLEAKAYTPIGEAILGITFKDMTYDNVGKKMYAIGVVNMTQYKLYTIGLSDGVCTAVADLSTPQVAIACSKEGQLYSISNAGDLNKLNKETAALEKVGSVGVEFDVFQSQCLEFDHNTGMLYWSYVTPDEPVGYLATIDLKTGKATAKKFKYEDQIIGLYFEKEVKSIWYGYQLYSDTYSDGNNLGVCTFDPEDLSTTAMIKPDQTLVGAAAYANGTYYGVTYYASMNDIINADGLCTFDLETGKILERRELENTPIMWDMTYDYSTHTMFSIATPHYGNSSLYKLVNGAKFEKVIDLDANYHTLACSLDGELYAITDDGVLNKLNKLTGNSEKMGSTGITYDNTVPTAMEFDHNTGKLYFSCNITKINKAVLANLNIQDGSVIKADTFPDRNQVIGLYIPFEVSNAVPQAVTNFKVTADDKGDLMATLSWTNPTTTVGGAELADKSIKIEILRNGKTITTLSDRTPGKAETWPDGASKQGFNNYVIKVSNSDGVSEAASVLLFVGKDVPGNPSNVKLIVTNDTKATLTWEAPTVGLNTGWFDKENVKYDVMRLPDSVKVATNQAALIFEEEISDMNFYSYVVTAHTNEGVGGSVTSNGATLGNGMAIPYHCMFETESEAGLWNLEDYWKVDFLGIGGNVRGLVHSANRDEISNEWAYSPLLKLEKGKTYKLSFGARCQTNGWLQKLKVCVGKEKTAAGQTQIIIDVPNLPGKDINNDEPLLCLNEYEGTFQVTENGLYSLGFLCYSGEYTSELHVSNILVEVTTDINSESNDSNMVVYSNGEKIYLEGEYSSATVYDQLGSSVYTVSTPVSTINANLASGVYFVKVVNGNKVNTYKVVIK